MDIWSAYQSYYQMQAGASQMPYYQQPGYPQGQPLMVTPITVTPQEKTYAVKKMIDVEAEMAKNAVATQNRMAVNEHKNQLDMQKAEHRARLQEEAYERRCLTILAISVNSDGYFELERISPDGSRRHSAGICSQKDFRGVYYYAVDSNYEENVLEITWQGEADGIILSGAKMTSTEMCRELAGRGVCFRVPRREKLEIMEKIFGYIVENSQKVEVPRTIGWTKNSEGVWRFEPEIANTLAGLRLQK